MTKVRIAKSLKIIVPVLGFALLAACATVDTDGDTSTGKDTATGSSGGTR